MPTLYIRDVPDRVAETLKARAAAEGKSLSAYVGTELTRFAARPTNAQVAAMLRERDRSTGPTSEEILKELQAGRR
jgi:plasmid stability protein